MSAVPTIAPTMVLVASARVSPNAVRQANPVSCEARIAARLMPIGTASANVIVQLPSREHLADPGARDGVRETAEEPEAEGDCGDASRPRRLHDGIGRRYPALRDLHDRSRRVEREPYDALGERVDRGRRGRNMSMSTIGTFT